MSIEQKTPLVGWIGDDFTGSAATLEVMAFAGLRKAKDRANIISYLDSLKD